MLGQYFCIGVGSRLPRQSSPVPDCSQYLVCRAGWEVSKLCVWLADVMAGECTRLYSTLWGRHPSSDKQYRNTELEQTYNIYIKPEEFIIQKTFFIVFWPRSHLHPRQFPISSCRRITCNYITHKTNKISI